jgi:hypothetical protein
VVCGDELDQRILPADAVRFRRRVAAWSSYGVLALVARDDIEVGRFLRGDAATQSLDKLFAWHRATTTVAGEPPTTTTGTRKTR